MPGQWCQMLVTGSDDVLREGSVAPDPETDRVGAQVAPAREAVAAHAAHDVTFAGDQVAGMEVVHVAADLDDLADELVADDERRRDGLRGPRVPRLDVQVRAADAGLADAHDHVVDPGLRVGHGLQAEARPGGGLHEGEHQVTVGGLSMTQFSTRPIPSTSQRTVSPGSRNTGGSRKTPTPDGVPVIRRSPGSSAMYAEM